jgi:hypothetical protein
VDGGRDMNLDEAQICDFEVLKFVFKKNFGISWDDNIKFF